MTLVAAPAASAQRPSKVELLWLPAGTTVSQLAAAGFSPGLMSPGLGTVPRQQTYLDVSQGNRVFDSLYDSRLPPLGRDCARWLVAVDKRAESAPAEIEPGLLINALESRGVGVFRDGVSSCAFGGPPGTGDGPISSGVLFVGDASLGLAKSQLKSLHPRDLLVAIANPAPNSDELVAIGVAGRGFDGDLTADSTRTDGYVLSTDVAPTILEHFGIAVPTQMSGQPIRSEGSVDPAAIDALGARMAVISGRRGPVIGFSLLAWIFAMALVVAVTRGAAARPAVRVVGLAVIYMPLVMLLGSAIKPGEGAEVLLVMLGVPLLAALTLLALSGYRALAAASALTVLAYAVDVIAGSPLTKLALLGPNPGLGVRFYGIGNELEALLGVLVVAGTGAALVGFSPRVSRRAGAGAFLAAGLGFAGIFAAGRFGADVGAAIVLPLGAAVAAAVLAARSRRTALLAVAAPFAMLALLALVDLVTGANAHLTRSVLDAGGLHALGDVAQRRLQLSVHSFGRPILLAFLPLVAALAALAVWRRDRLAAWLRAAPALRAGLIGALAATAIGTLANDSGALLLEIGTAYLLVFVGFAWTESERRPGGPGR